MFGSSHRLFRPPAEADSLILRIVDGCPHNQCTFCGMYKSVRYRVHRPEEIAGELCKAQVNCPGATRIFLADGDVMLLPFAALRDLLTELNRLFSALVRVGVYANGSSITAKSREELCELRKLKLHTLYMGLESGDEALLRAVRKEETAEQMIAAGRLAQECGLRMSVMVLLGLGGHEGSAAHAVATAAALNRLQPRLLSALRVIPLPGTVLHAERAAGRFRELTEYETVCELRNLLARLELAGTVFRANHASNIVPLEGRFPRDQARLLQELDVLLASETLDRESPGPEPWAL